MATYGYGGATTTSYGAQGGADGGGFVGGGSQPGSQDTSGGNSIYAKESLRPVTIKQIHEGTKLHEDKIQIDGSNVTQVTFVGQVQSVAPQATNITFKIDDSTGIIEAKQWVDSDSDPENPKALPREGDYVRVYGPIKDFGGKRHVGVRSLRTVTDFNEVQYHYLEATAVHLFFTRGPPESGGTNGVKNEHGGGGLFVDSNGGGNNNTGEGSKQLPRLNAPAKKVFSLLQNTPQNNEGLNIHNISTSLGMERSEVFKAGDELLGLGLIYTTVDDETWAVLEEY